MSSSGSLKLDKSLEGISSEILRDSIGDGTTLGLGSGSTVARFAKYLGEMIRGKGISVQVVPSSMQAWLLATENGMPLASDSAHCPASLDVAVDGADQISVRSRSMIKGGGGALLKEKIILSSAKRSFIIGDFSKFVPLLSRPVPVEVTQFGLRSVEWKLKDLYHCEPVLRKLDKGYPFYTESGNVILDCQFGKQIEEPVEIEKNIKLMAGVLEVGIFNCKIERFYKANQDGTFESY